MERLEPILKQKFWILLGLGIVMTATGWWVGTGSQAATIADRTKVIDGAFSSVPSGEIPNSDWTTQLSTRNAEQERAIRSTSMMLWNRQRERMFWPASIQAMAWENGYRGNIRLEGCEIYRQAYGYEVRRVWESLRPYIQQDGTGIVVYGQDEKILPQKTWGRLPPSPAEMWDAQEDLWLIESLFRSIVAVNGGPEAQRGDASIHMMEKFMLVGGVPAASRKATGGGSTGGATAGPASGPAGGGGAHGAAAPMTGGFGGASSGGEMGGQRSQIASADFDPKEEFGDDGSKGAGAGGFGGESRTAMSSLGMSGPAAGHGGAAGGPPGAPGAAGAAGASTVKRYIEEEARFKTRGFYMTLIMDHRKIPALVAEMSASEYSAWPVEIVRVQMVRLHDDDVGSGFASGGMSTMTGMNSMTGNSSAMVPPGYANTRVQSAEGEDGEQGVTNLTAAAAGTAALESARQDPFMARVAICGTITLYTEVKPDPVPAAVAPAAAPSAPATVPGVAPENPADTPATPGVTPTDPGVPAESTPNAEGTPPATESPADPAKSDSNTPAEPPAAKPSEATTPDAAPKEPDPDPKIPEKN
ncbi:MAG: hypothetical protein JSS49_15075 [Planctomycetes bacterium]|nr:hypothetical protein [Planctomycetota bacterium]